MLFICLFVHSYDFAGCYPNTKVAPRKDGPRVRVTVENTISLTITIINRAAGLRTRAIFFFLWPAFFLFFVDISTMKINIVPSSCTHLKPFKFVNNIKTIRNH